CGPIEIGISAEENSAVSYRLIDNALSKALDRMLADESIPKSVHDYKFALRLLSSRSVSEEISLEPYTAVAGVRDDVMLFSYLLNPTYSSHSLAEVALRRFNLQLSGMIAEAADVTLRLGRVLRTEVEGEIGLINVYETIDLPLVPVLARMEAA